MTATQIKERFNKKLEKDNYSFNSYFEKHIRRQKAEATKALYRYTLGSIEKFHPGKLTFADVNVRFLKDYEDYLRQSVGTNTISIYMRNIRTVFNSAIDDEIVDLNYYPFRKFKIKSERTKKEEPAN